MMDTSSDHRRQRAEDRLASLDEAARRMDHVESEVAAYELRIEGVINRLASTEVEGKMDDGLGSVVVNGEGRLVRVKFDPDRLSATEVSEVGGHILTAISRARSTLNQNLRAGMKQAAREIGF